MTRDQRLGERRTGASKREQVEDLHLDVVDLLRAEPGLDYSDVAGRLGASRAAVRFRVEAAQARGELYDYYPTRHEVSFVHTVSFTGLEGARACDADLRATGLDCWLHQARPHAGWEIKVVEQVHVQARRGWQDVIRQTVEAHGGALDHYLMEHEEEHAAVHGSCLLAEYSLGHFTGRRPALSCQVDLQRHGLPTSLDKNGFYLLPVQRSRTGTSEWETVSRRVREKADRHGGIYRGEVESWHALVHPDPADPGTLSARLAARREARALLGKSSSSPFSAAFPRAATASKQSLPAQPPSHPTQQAPARAADPPHHQERAR